MNSWARKVKRALRRAPPGPARQWVEALLLHGERWQWPPKRTAAAANGTTAGRRRR